MVDENKNKSGMGFGWKLFIVVLMIVSLISTIIATERSQAYESYREYIKENYEYNCGEGYERSCIESGKQSYSCDNDEWGVCVGEDEDLAKCNINRKEQAICVSEDYDLWTTCKDGYKASCVEKDKSWRVCDTGEQAICVTKGLYAIYNGAYVRSCNSGETAYCN